MAWTINSTRIYVQDVNDENKQIIARLNPFGGGTIHHIFGYEDPILNLKAVVIGSGNMDLLEGYTKTGSSYSLVTPYGTWGNYLVNKTVKKILPGICQTIDRTLPDTAPVYSVDLELYKDV